MKTVIITGSASGLGAELVEQFRKGSVWEAVGIDRNNCNLRNWYEVKAFCAHQPVVDVLINCAGVNRIAYLENVRLSDWNEAMEVNVRAPFLLTQALLPQLAHSRGTVCNVISNASHVPMTASLAYNASKAALHMMTLQLARELTKRHGITVLGISPNKMRGTGMSRDIEQQVMAVRGWSEEYATAYQKNALLTGEETDPKAVAEFMFWLLSVKERHVSLSGSVLPYGV